MEDNPRTYEIVKRRILRDFHESYPNIKIKTYDRWHGVTEWKGKECDITIPESAGPTAVKVLLHEISHCIYGPVKPVVLGEFLADQSALRMCKKYGIPITDRMLQRIYSYMVKKLDRAMRSGIRVVPEELKPFVKDVLAHRQMGDKWWRENARDKNLGNLLQMMEV